MPSSFSRFLSPEELERVRQLYFESLKDDGKPEEGAARAPLDARPAEPGDAAPKPAEKSG